MNRQLATTQARPAPQLPPGRAPAPAPLPAELDGHLATLTAWTFTGGGDLVPAAALPALRAELERRNQPATSRYQLAVLAAMLAGFPQRAPEHVEAYLGALIEETSDYSDDVLYQAAREIRRTVRFLPTIAEFREIADKHAKAATVMMARLDQMERQHAAIAREQRLQQLYGGRVSLEDANGVAASLRGLAARAYPLGLSSADVRAWWQALFGELPGCEAGSEIALQVIALHEGYGGSHHTREPAKVVELVKKISQG